MHLLKERAVVELRRAKYAHTAEKLLQISPEVRNELIDKFYLRAKHLHAKRFYMHRYKDSEKNISERGREEIERQDEKIKEYEKDIFSDDPVVTTIMTVLKIKPHKNGHRKTKVVEKKVKGFVSLVNKMKEPEKPPKFEFIPSSHELI